MYKGNMYEFAERLFVYIEKKYSVKLGLNKSEVHDDYYYVSSFPNIGGRFPNNYVQDDDDYEEQMYTAVSWVLKNLGVL